MSGNEDEHSRGGNECEKWVTTTRSRKQCRIGIAIPQTERCLDFVDCTLSTTVIAGGAIASYHVQARSEYAGCLSTMRRSFSIFLNELTASAKYAMNWASSKWGKFSTAQRIIFLAQARQRAGLSSHRYA